MNKETRNTNYNLYVESRVPKTKAWPSLLKAFILGGIICAIGQGFFDLYSYIFPNLAESEVTTAMLMTIIFITCFLNKDTFSNEKNTQNNYQVSTDLLKA